MTDIDPQADIAIVAVDQQVTARVPLKSEPSQDWQKSYDRMAETRHVPAHVEVELERAWVVVTVPVDGSHRDVTGTLDSARTLIADTDEAAARAQAPAGAADSVRMWWTARRAAAARKETSKTEVVRTGMGIDKPWVLACALIAAIAVLFVLPSRFSIGPNWLAPALEGLLLAALLLATLAHSSRRRAIVRVLSCALVLVLVANAAFITVRLVIDLVEGGPETNSPTDLIKVGSAVWVYVVISFAFLYWLLDGGGPESRIWDPPEFPDLAFPQQLNPQVARPGWRPEFIDYLYLGYTDATAFSPTDVMPLARWGKAAMTIQSVASFAIGGLVIARAVNIFK
ncbi:MAG TPA: hypothetical protein VEV61_07165 [Streptosporangiaceae bacterium]|nr:hypothetical protein [Streptosporangiaceae bacterium]